MDDLETRLYRKDKDKPFLSAMKNIVLEIEMNTVPGCHVYHVVN